MVEATIVALLAVVALAVTASTAPLPRGKQKPLSQREVEEIARKLTDELAQEVTKAAHEAIKDTNTMDMNDQEGDEPPDDSTSSTTSYENHGKENSLSNKETLSYKPKDDARTLITHNGFNTKLPDKTVMEKEHFFEDIHFPRDHASHTNQKGTGEHKETGDTEDLEESDSGAQQTTIINQKANKGGKKSGDHDEDLNESDSEFGKKKKGKSLANAQPSALKNQKEISTTPVEPNKNKKLPLELQEIYYEITEITEGNEEARTTKSGPKQTHISTETANPVTNTKTLILIDNDKDDLKTEPMLPSSPANKWKRATVSESEYGIHSMPKCKNCIYGQTGKLEKVSTADPMVPVDYKETNGDEEEGGSSTGKAFLQDLDDDAQEIGRRLAKVLSRAARARRNAPQRRIWHRMRGLAGGRGQAATAPGMVAEGGSSGFPQMTLSAIGL